MNAFKLLLTDGAESSSLSQKSTAAISLLGREETGKGEINLTMSAFEAWSFSDVWMLVLEAFYHSVLSEPPLPKSVFICVHSWLKPENGEQTSFSPSTHLKLFKRF